MRSSSRNSRINTRALGLATAASLLLGSGAQAGDSSHNFVLTAYSNGKGGPALVSGDYTAATAALRSNANLSAFDAGTTSNNRCVMLTVTKQWDSAHGACDKAVHDAQQEKAMLPSYQYWARKLQNEYLAVALSNRAVLHWMSSDAQSAAADLQQAAKLAPTAPFVVSNRQALEFSKSSSTVAQVAVSPASP